MQKIHKKEMPLHRKATGISKRLAILRENRIGKRRSVCSPHAHSLKALCAPVLLSHPQQRALFVLHSAPRSLVILLNYAALLSLFHYYCCSHRALLLLQPRQPALVSPRKSDYGSKSFCTHTHKPLPGF
jgi:hypothetical protein